MATNELKQPLGASIIRALGLADGDIPKFILADLERDWDRIAFFTIYATFSNPTCRPADDNPADERTCCKYEAISTSPEEKSNVSIKVAVPTWGTLEVSGTGSLRPQIVDPLPIKPVGDCPGRCRDESIQIVIQLVYHFSLHFKLQLGGSGTAAGANFKFPGKATHATKSTTSAAVDIEFDWDGDAHDSLKVYANCELIATNNKDKRPWLDDLPGSAGGKAVPRPFDPATARLAVDDCNVEVVGNLIGFTQSGRGGRVVIDMTPSVGGIPQIPPQANFPIGPTGAVTPRQFTIWTGAVPKGCSSYFEVNAVFDLELFNQAGQSLATEKVTVKQALFCPEDDKRQFTASVTFSHKASLILYVRVNMSC